MNRTHNYSKLQLQLHSYRHQNTQHTSYCRVLVFHDNNFPPPLHRKFPPWNKTHTFTACVAMHWNIQSLKIITKQHKQHRGWKRVEREEKERAIWVFVYFLGFPTCEGVLRVWFCFCRIFFNDIVWIFLHFLGGTNGVQIVHPTNWHTLFDAKGRTKS